METDMKAASMISVRQVVVNPKEAAQLIAVLEKENAKLLAICKIFLGEDDRFQVSVGGNPIAVDKMLAEARAIVTNATV